MYMSCWDIFGHKILKLSLRNKQNILLKLFVRTCRSTLVKSFLCLLLCLIPRTTVMSLIALKDTRCKTHPLCVNPGVPFWTREKTHKLRARYSSIFVQNTRWRHGRSRGETKYSPRSIILNLVDVSERNTVDPALTDLYSGCLVSYGFFHSIAIHLF